MAEQILPAREEGEQPEGVVAQPSGQPSEASPGLSSSVGQPGGTGQAGDVSGQETGTPPPERSRRRKVIVIAAAAGAVVLIAGGITLGLALSGGSSNPSFPTTLLGIPRDTSSDAQQVAGQITSTFSVFQGMIVHPAVAIYGSGPPNGMVVMTGQWSQAAKADGLISVAAAGALDGLRARGVTDASSFPAGPGGGSLACGQKTIAGQSTIVCDFWDRKGFMITFYFGNASSPRDAATKTLQVRSEVEH